MSKKIISSKETYFKRPNNPMSLEDWNNFKLANPRPEYLGETCWSLHDSMILRGKPADDSAVVKILLKETDIKFEQHVDYLKITSDLTGKDVLVVEIECDELLEQLSAAGARVLYITSNVNYDVKAPEKYFEMYNDSAYDTNDYPATDKRNMFTNKNVIIKYFNFNDYKKKGLYYIFLQNVLKEHNMKINKVLMNPPYDGSLHLEVLEATLKASRETNAECEVVSVQPAYWIEDILAEYKNGTDYRKYKKSIVCNISKIQLVTPDDASYKFGIELNSDLGIYTFNSEPNNVEIFNMDVISIVNKIRNKLTTTIKDVLEQMQLDGIRAEIHEMLPAATGTKGGQSFAAKTNVIAMVNLRNNAVFVDGYNQQGIFWTEDGRAKNGSSKNIGAAFPYSIKFNTILEANNFVESCRTNFYKNLIYLLKFNAHTPFAALPYMEDYSKVWTDEDYCKFFGLTEEESEFMCRKVDDYRVKDFINHINLDEE